MSFCRVPKRTTPCSRGVWAKEARESMTRIKIDFDIDNPFFIILMTPANLRLQFIPPLLTVNHLSRCPRSRSFFLANQLTGGLPTRGCAPRPRRPEAEEAWGQGDTSSAKISLFISANSAG